MPPAGRAPGRVQVVDHRVRECQIGSTTGAEAREIAVAGQVAVPLPGMPGTVQAAPIGASDTAETADTASANPGADLQLSPVSPDCFTPAVSPATVMSLREAVEAGILTGKLSGVRMARHRHRVSFPQVVGYDGMTELYDPDELALWEQCRRNAA